MDFRPTKANFSDISLWIKLPNFLLCCWNETRISKVASRVGISLAIDNLTTFKSRLTFARVCVKVSSKSKLLDSVSINLNRMHFEQEILYDGKPEFYKNCSSFSHEDNTCPNNPSIPLSSRIRSRSRPP